MYKLIPARLPRLVVSSSDASFFFVAAAIVCLLLLTNSVVSVLSLDRPAHESSRRKIYRQTVFLAPIREVTSSLDQERSLSLYRTYLEVDVSTE